MRNEPLLASGSVARHAAWWQVAALSVITSAAVVGCPGTLDNPGQFVDDAAAGSAGSGGSGGSSGEGGVVQCDITPVANVPTELFAMTCGTTSCHDSSAPAGELDLISPDLESRLIDRPSSQCGVKTLVDSAAPENSFLLEKVTRTPDACGDRMPLGGMLPPAKIACVREWIDLITANGGPTDAATD